MEILFDKIELTDKVRSVKHFCEAFSENFENLGNSITVLCIRETRHNF